ncbi:MAG: hypothetical protein HZB25_09565 [Candidatus Eisenbacteria bacterium]|nr:hypothetical protein [Candidatus Eisenbacteria bacterium]
MLMATFRRITWLAALALLLAAASASAQTVKINEIRTDNSGTDTDEYFELKGPAGMSLAGYYYIVIGDGSSGTSRCGFTESVVNLGAFSLQADGLLCLRNTAGTPALTGYDGSVALTFENSDNVTHMLVMNFTGTNNQDLDTNDDGVFDLTPWTSIEDAVGLSTGVAPNCTGGVEHIYAATVLGPDGANVPGHVYRCSDTGAWVIGTFTPLGTTDTPGAPNFSCAAPPPEFRYEMRSPCAPLVSESPTVTAVARHSTGADLYYKVNGGAETRIGMTLSATSGDTSTFTAVLPGQPTDGDRVEYYVRAFNATPDTTQDFNQGYFVGLVSVSALRVNDGNGAAMYRFYGARVRGNVTVPYGVFSTTDTDFYIQDATGGIDLFKYGLHSVQPVLGDDVTVEGTIEQYQGKLEIASVGSCDTLLLTVNGSGSAPAPLTLPCAFGESEEGELVRMANVTLVPGADTAFVGNKTYKIITSCNDTTSLRIDAATDIPGMRITSTTINTLRGIVNQVDSNSPYTIGYQLMPRNRFDLALGTTGVEDGAKFQARLGSAMPNPASRTARIEFTVPGASGKLVPVRLALYDVQGRLRHVMLDGALEPGPHSATLDARSAGMQANGIYFYRLELPGRTMTRKLVLVK